MPDDLTSPDQLPAVAEPESCKNCLYIFLNLTPRVHCCRRYPPVVVHTNTYWTYWPTVQLTDWCGDWKKMPANPPFES